VTAAEGEEQVVPGGGLEMPELGFLSLLGAKRRSLPSMKSITLPSGTTSPASALIFVATVAPG